VQGGRARRAARRRARDRRVDHRGRHAGRARRRAARRHRRPPRSTSASWTEALARVAALVDAFNKAGFGAREAADIRHVEWEKLLQITVLCAWSVSALGVMPGGSVAEALVVREAAEHYLAIARELLAVYRSLGYEPQDFFAPYSRFPRARARERRAGGRGAARAGPAHARGRA
jgi:ketopantoate reductase